MTGLVQDAAPAIAPVETEVLLELDDLVVDYLEADRRCAPSTTST